MNFRKLPPLAASRAGLCAALLVLASLAAAMVPPADRWLARKRVDDRLFALRGLARLSPPVAGRLLASNPPAALGTGGTALASWQSIGGCGAGSATGIGGIKWIGRNVRGGAVNLQSQANYTQYRDGYAYTINNQITTDIGESWTIGAVVPYLDKYINDPYELGYDLSNQGLGDVNLLLTRRLGEVKATSVTLSIGLPTGTHDAGFLVNNPLPQDRQLGAGKPSAGLMIDHVIDHLWGTSVIGAAGSYPGAVNDLENYRAPSGSLYGYVGYFLGPFVPSVGVSAIGFLGEDRDRGLPSDSRPPYMVAANASLEWSTDWVALLAGVSQPFWTTGRQPWTVGLGLALAPF